MGQICKFSAKTTKIPENTGRIPARDVKDKPSNLGVQMPGGF